MRRQVMQPKPPAADEHGQNHDQEQDEVETNHFDSEDERAGHELESSENSSLEEGPTRETTPDEEQLRTPTQIERGILTPDTWKRRRHRWQETTVSQIGVPYSGMDDESVDPVWEDSIIDVYDESELPQRTNVELSKITSSRLFNCETENVHMVDVVGVYNRRLINMEVRGIDDARVLWRRIEGKAVDWNSMKL